MTVPKGDYVATGGCTANNSNGSNFGDVDSSLTSDNDPSHNVNSFVSVPNTGYHLFIPPFIDSVLGDAKSSDVTGFHLPNGGTITQTCNTDSFSQATGLGIFDLQITATQVSKLNG